MPDTLSESLFLNSAPLLSPSGPVEILVVDSNASNRQWMRRELESRQNCKVTEAASVEAASDLISLRRKTRTANAQLNEETVFDVIFLDNDLIEQSGTEILYELRLQGDATPVVVITDEGQEESALAAMRQGACDYIVKSGQWAKFFPRVVSNVVERDRLRRYYNRLEAEHVRFARLAAIGEVIAGIAHEIRNPMQVISGMASLIRENSEVLSREELDRCAQGIVENCAHLQKVLDDVLCESQPDFEREPLSLAEVAEETIAFMRFDSDFRRYAVVERNFKTAEQVVGNRDQLKQILINLLRNAAQAIALAGRDSGRVRVSILEEGTDVVLIVDDEGHGIEQELLPRIFESGFSTKLRNGRSTEKPENSGQGGFVRGSGLGLHICRRLIEEHDGRIWADKNTTFGGARFCITLPKAPNA